MLTQEQEAIVNCNHRHFKVLSAAGSGKTTVLTSRIKRLCTEGVSPSSIMAITFTRRAGKELRSRLGEGFKDALIGTFHSAILNIMHEHGKSVNVLDEREVEGVICRCATRLGYRVGNTFRKGSISGFLKEVRDYRNGDGSMTPMVKAFLAELSMNGDTDFDGILVAGIELAKAGAFDWVGHLFVDEAQDNEPLQWQLVDEIAKKASVMVVGDIGQSLYSFRGAVPEHFSKLPWPSLEMTESFRFTSNIAKVANKTKATPLRVVSKKPAGPIITRETEDICSVVRGLLSAGAAHEDIAVLCRYNRQVDMVRSELTSSGINVVVPRIKTYGQIHYLLMYLANPSSATARGKVSWIGDRPKIVQYILSNMQGNLTAQAVEGWLDLTGRNVNSVVNALKVDEFSKLEAQWICENYAGMTISEYRNEESTPEWIAEGDGVTVGTVHWSKGGEWPIVIVPYVDDGKWPRGRMSAEEKRVLYVAITRAIEELHVLHGVKPSPFLDFFHGCDLPYMASAEYK